MCKTSVRRAAEFCARMRVPNGAEQTYPAANFPSGINLI